MSSGDHDHLPVTAMPRAPVPGLVRPPVATPGFAALAGELDRFARHRLSLYGSWLWWRLDRAQRRGLTRRELVRILTAGMCAQSVLSLLPRREPDAGTHRNSSLFVRLAAATGVVPYRPPVAVRLAARMSAWLPPGPMDPGVLALAEQVAAQLTGALADDPQRQAHVRRVAHLRLRTGLRHLEHAREDLVAAMNSRAPVANSLRRWALAATTAAAQALVIHPELRPGSGPFTTAAAAHRVRPADVDRGYGGRPR
ncbi:hypothetical protein [Nocardia wallacei]|uniref:hypothetical protein n=1 Tax=Nocardia wallacei TaxID=480035 RepID=UPI00245658D8|nr:hypothetical protein [Nocardia wallacei]